MKTSRNNLDLQKILRVKPSLENTIDEEVPTEFERQLTIIDLAFRERELQESDSLTRVDINNRIGKDQQRYVSLSSLAQGPLSSVISDPPAILSSIKLPQVSIDKIRQSIRLSQAEKELVKKLVTTGLSDVSEGVGADFIARLEEAGAAELKSLKDKIDAIADMYDRVDKAAQTLGLSSSSKALMNQAASMLNKTIKEYEKGNEALPETLHEFLSLTIEDNDLVKDLSATEVLYAIIHRMLVSCTSTFPSVIGIGLLTPEDGTIPILPEISLPQNFGTLKQLPNEKSFIKVLQRQRGSSTKGKNTVFYSFNQPARLDDWDYMRNAVCLISNELLLSAGIGRVQNTAVYKKFLKRTTTNTFRPFDKLLGRNPEAYDVKNISGIRPNTTTAPTIAGFLNYRKLEENGQTVGILPLESSSYISDSLISGVDYFLESGINNLGESGRLPRQHATEFSDEFGSFIKDASSYLDKILFLDDEQKLSPEHVLATIFEDIKNILYILSDNTINNDIKTKKVIMSAAMLEGFPRQRTRYKLRFLDKYPTYVRCQDFIHVCVHSAFLELVELDEIALRPIQDGSTDTSTTVSQVDIAIDTNTASETGPTEAPRRSLNDLLIGSHRWIDSASPIRKVGSTTENKALSVEIDPSDYENYTPYDDSSLGSINLFNAIVRTTVNLQKEAFRLSRIDDQSSGYTNDAGYSLLSGTDQSVFLAYVTNLYMKIAKNVLPITLVDNDKKTYECTWDPRDAQRITGLLDTLVNDLRSGAPIDDTTYDRLELAPGDNIIPSADTTPADLVELAKSIKQHRYYIKSSAAIFKSLPKVFSTSLNQVASIYKVLNNDMSPEELEAAGKTEQVIYETFVNQENESPYSRHQNSLNRLAYETLKRGYDSAEEKFSLRLDSICSPAEKSAVKIVADELYNTRGSNSKFIISLGIPPSTMRHMVKNFGEQSGRFRVVLDWTNELFTSTDSPIIENANAVINPITFDPELFVIPGSIEFDPDSGLAEGTPGPKSLQEIFSRTTFTRIRNGKIVDTFLGSTAQGIDRDNALMTLKSYLYDIFLYETAGIRHVDGAGLRGPIRLKQPAYEMLQAASLNTDACRSLACRPGFINFFDSSTLAVKQGASLKNTITGAPTSLGYSDFLHASYLTLVPQLTDNSGIIKPRAYDRVFNFVIDETLLSSVSNPDSRQLREKFDIYSLTVKLVPYTLA